MIYKKIKKAKENLLKMNAIEAAQTGAKNTSPLQQANDPGGLVSRVTTTFN